MFGQPIKGKEHHDNLNPKTDYIMRVKIGKELLHVTSKRVNNNRSGSILVNIVVPGIMKDRKPRGRRMSHNYAGYE